MLEKVCQCNNICTICEKQGRLEWEYLGISEAEPLRFICVNQFPHKDSVGHSLIYEF